MVNCHQTYPGGQRQRRHVTWVLLQAGREVGSFGSSSLLGFCTGGKLSIWLLVFIFNPLVKTRQQFRAGRYKIPRLTAIPDTLWATLCVTPEVQRIKFQVANYLQPAFAGNRILLVWEMHVAREYAKRLTVLNQVSVETESQRFETCLLHENMQGG